MPHNEGTKHIHITEDKVIFIPASAYCDDLILFSDSRDDMECMVENLNKFVIATGMRLSPLKCKFTSVHYGPSAQISPRARESLSVHDHHNNVVNIHWQDPTIPISYLGYSWVLAATQRTQGHSDRYCNPAWTDHNKKFISKFIDKCVRLRQGPIRSHDLVEIINSDIMSVIPYYTAATHLTLNEIKQMKSEIWQVVYRKAHAMINLPRGALFIPATENGLGIHDIKAVWHTAAIDLLCLCMQTPDAICRVTTVDTMQEAAYEHNFDVFKPARLLSAKSNRFPTYIKTACNAMSVSGITVEVNKFNITPENVPILSALLPHLTEPYRCARITRLLLSNKIWSLGDLLPSLTSVPETSATTQSNFTCSLFEHIITRTINMSWVDLLPVLSREVTASVKFHGSKNKSIERGCIIDALANMIDSWRTMPEHQLPFMLARRRYDGPVTFMNLFTPTPAGPHDHLNIATDGSYNITSNTAGTGVTDGVNTFFGPIPGKQSIDRAEAFGMLTALKSLCSISAPAKIWTDSRSTIDAINRVRDIGRYQPRPDRDYIRWYRIIR